MKQFTSRACLKPGLFIYIQASYPRKWSRFLKSQGIQTHAWDVNSVENLTFVTGIGIPKVCTDNFRMVHAYREGITTVHGN